MHDLDPNCVTEAVIHQMAATPDLRLREVMESLVWHLHAFAYDVSLTPAESLAALGFLTRVGQACTPDRQEFILLSDVLGLSRVVNALGDAQDEVDATPETGLPGLVSGGAAPEFAPGDSIATRAGGGPEMAVFGRVVDDAGCGIPGASVQVWQVGPEGVHRRGHRHAQVPSAADMRGRFTTGADGSYAFRTVRPRGSTIPMDGPVGRLVRMQGRHGRQPAHIRFSIAAPGHRELATALYLAGDEHIGSDTAFGVAERLVVTPEVGLEGSPRPDLPGVRYDFRITRTPVHGASDRVGADPSKVFRPPASSAAGRQS